jgi:hypothetical protein
MNYLAHRMHTGIGSTGGDNPYRVIRNFSQGFLQDILNGAYTDLRLPTLE